MKVDLTKFEKLSVGKGRGSSCNDGVSIRTQPPTANTGTQTHVRVGVEVMKALRWVCGDRVSLYICHETCEMVIMRNPDGELCLTGSGYQKDYRGKILSGTIKLKVKDCDLTQKTLSNTLVFPHTITDDNMLLVDYKVAKNKGE